jgi:hypothetical protein
MPFPIAQGQYLPDTAFDFSNTTLERPWAVAFRNKNFLGPATKTPPSADPSSDPAGWEVSHFPTDEIFRAPMADQKQPRTHITWQRFRGDFGYVNLGSVGFGDSFGLFRGENKAKESAWQLGISGAVLAIFNMDAASIDLLNADYIVGFPFSYRYRDWSFRARLYHQSSHLGDEFLLEEQPIPTDRLNIAFEAIELLAAWEQWGFRVYGGPSFIFLTRTSLERTQVQGGLEFQSHDLWDKFRYVAAVEVKSWAETDWHADWSIKTGLAVPSPYSESRSVLFLLEYYDGHMPHGQFYPWQVEYFGLGVGFSF